MQVFLLSSSYPTGLFLQGLKIFLRKTASGKLFGPSGPVASLPQKLFLQPRKNILASRRKNRADP